LLRIVYRTSGRFLFASPYDGNIAGTGDLANVSGGTMTFEWGAFVGRMKTTQGGIAPTVHTMPADGDLTRRTCGGLSHNCDLSHRWRAEILQSVFQVRSVGRSVSHEGLDIFDLQNGGVGRLVNGPSSPKRQIYKDRQRQFCRR
jgi:hypothetical protein